MDYHTPIQRMLSLVSLASTQLFEVFPYTKYAVPLEWVEIQSVKN